MSNAGGHRIVHIGTHAEYNNIHPERSGLVFAKNTNKEDDNNFLSLFDIYNCNIQSNLTILTACESGKPGYQDGEGMVSLAHAFNYAGSNRILTALWEIDENSSSKISEYFIHLLKKGFATDEALQLAKIKYLQQANGRTLAPAYWAGLILMGEPATISLPSFFQQFLLDCRRNNIACLIRVFFYAKIYGPKVKMSRQISIRHFVLNHCIFNYRCYRKVNNRCVHAF